MGIHPIHAAITTPYIEELIRIKAGRLIQRPGFRKSERSDMEQELKARVLKEAHLFDPARSSVNTFIDRVVQSAAGMIVRERRWVKHAAGFRLLSLEEPDFNGTHRESTLGENIGEADLYRRHGRTPNQARNDGAQTLDVALALAPLPPIIRQIAARLADESETSIARSLGISRRQVRNAIPQIREALLAGGLGEIPPGGGPISDRKA
jgi:DNA-directed RNA polymerase specialized sigma24 family protein